MVGTQNHGGVGTGSNECSVPQGNSTDETGHKVHAEDGNGLRNAGDYVPEDQRW